MEEKNLISMREAAKISPYEQGYLSLLARRGELKAEKVGRNWFTSVEWLNEYLKNKKPDKLIEFQKERKFFNFKIFQRKKELAWFLVSSFLFLGLVIYWWQEEKRLVNGVKEVDKPDYFISEEIVKIPNENGGYDVYEVGRRKIKEEVLKEQKNNNTNKDLRRFN